MNHAYEQEIRYRLLKVLSQDPQLSQRDMAKRMGISLGKVNYCISELAAKGLIKITRFRSAKNKIPYTYLLTPKGLEEETDAQVFEKEAIGVRRDKEADKGASL